MRLLALRAMSHLSDEIAAGGVRVSGQEKQQGSQQHRLQDEEQVIDQDPRQHHIPVLLSGASIPDHGTHHVDAQEGDT